MFGSSNRNRNNFPYRKIRKFIISMGAMSLFIIGSILSHGSHSHAIDTNSYMGRICKTITEFLSEKLDGMTKEQQAYIGVTITSSAPIPIFLLIIIFNLKNIKLLDIMSAFASGALLGDVMLHNLPEIMHSHSHSHNHDHDHDHDHDHNHSHSLFSFLIQKEVLLCIGVVTLFTVEKIIALINGGNNSHGHSHGDDDTKKPSEMNNSSTNVIMAIIGDFFHNVTDGLAIGAAYNKNMKLGITLTISIFFHELPHEIGDFSYLLKQSMSKIKALNTQVFSSIGAFLGVYLSKLIVYNI